MNPMLAFLLALFLFSLGIVIFLLCCFNKFKRPQPLYIKAVFDVNDQRAFNAIMGVISAYDLLDADYGETEDISYAMIGVTKNDYTPILRSLQAIQNVEVI